MPKFSLAESLMSKVSKATEIVTPTNISANLNKAFADAESVVEKMYDSIVSAVKDTINQTINSAIGLVNNVVDTVIGIGKTIYNISEQLLSFIKSNIENVQDLYSQICDTFNEDDLEIDISIDNYIDSVLNSDVMNVENAESQNNIMGNAVSFAQDLSNKDIKILSKSSSQMDIKVKDIISKSTDNYKDYAKKLSKDKADKQKENVIIQQNVNNNTINYTDGSINIKNAKINILNG